MRVEVERAVLALREPLATAHGTIRDRRLLRLRLTAADGITGVGEAAALESYDGVPLDACAAALEDCRAPLERSDGADHGALLAACREQAVLPQAIAAVDLALWDLRGRRAGRPVWQLLGAAAGGPVAVNATIGATDRAGAAEEAGEATRAGFRCVKVKVGLGDDAGRIAAVRAAAGRRTAIRIDANGAWTVEQAVAALAALAPAGIELCEEPVHGSDAVAAVRARSAVPVAIDETAGEPGAIAAGIADAVCLKVAAQGGITGVLAAAAAAREAGAAIYLASTLDGPHGIAAALHAAAALAPDLPCGLATLGLFADVEDPFPPADGAMRAPDAPGLGVGDG